MNAQLFQRRIEREAVRRRALTIIELVVAVALLAVLLASAMKMIYVITNQQRASERRNIALEAVQAIAEQAGNIPFDQLSTDAAKQFTIPAPTAQYLPDGKLNVTVSEETNPAAKRVRAELTWRTRPTERSAPVRITTWVFPDTAK